MICIQQKHLGKGALSNKETMERLCILVLILGSFLKILYSYMVPFNISPHDLGKYVLDNGLGTGHLGYIQQLSYHHAFPASISGQYYHPPLFHLIGAIIYSIISPTPERIPFAFEVIQTVNMLFACITSLYAWKIIKKNIRNPYVKFIAVCMISFAPIFYNIGVTINNDCLMILLLTITIYKTICWIEEPSLKRILQIAIVFTLAILTKSSAILLSPAIGCVFLSQLIHQKEQRKLLWKQYITFGAVCIPLGLSWVIRNKVLFNVAFNYIPKMKITSPQYVGMVPFWKRLFLPSGTQFLSTSINWNIPANHANIGAQTLLTLIIDESLPFAKGRILSSICILLTWIFSIVQIISVIALAKVGFNVLTKKYEERKVHILYFVGATVIMASYVLFCFQYPFICTMNARYIVIVVIIGTLCCTSVFDKDSLNRFEKTAYKIWSVSVVISSILSGVLFFIGPIIF